MTIPSGARVVVAMSGGVDSSVAAAKLRREGYEVLGVTLRLRSCDDNLESRSCCGVDGIVQARAVAATLGIPHYVLGCEKEFERDVLAPAWQEYDRGRTPSPCLWCNERIKFGLLLRWAKEVGASFVATGHYARINLQPSGEAVLHRAKDPRKDQSYFLARLDQGQLASVVFPIAEYDKTEVREMARRLGLPTAERHESQDACLVAQGTSFAETLRRRFDAKARRGAVVDTDGRVWGQHAGIHHFTVGQRRGLGFGTNGRAFVKEIRPDTSTVVITHRQSELDSRHLVARHLVWSAAAPVERSFRCEVQVRYRHRPQSAVVMLGPDRAEVAFDEPVHAITKGQAAVFYAGTAVLGSGWIHGLE